MSKVYKTLRMIEPEYSSKPALWFGGVNTDERTKMLKSKVRN